MRDTTEVGPFGRRDDQPRFPLRLSDARPRATPAREAPSPQPIPLETMVLQRDGGTYIARSWEDRDDAAKNCRLCPKSVCRVSPLGLCLVRIEGFVPTALAPLRPMTSPGLGIDAVTVLGLGRDGARR